jgi:hypothetical protein
LLAELIIAVLEKSTENLPADKELALLPTEWVTLD